MNERRRAAFTLIELMVVILIIGIAMGMIAFLPAGDSREAAVKGAAEELAATLRTARARAMDQRCMIGVSFNIQNAPGTSGLVLNNNSGGHWYRVTGPAEIQGAGGAGGGYAIYPAPIFYYGNDTIPAFFDSVQSSWAGDRHVLTPRKVRFLALSDQDNGSLIDHEPNNLWSTYLPTYPRPWFGNWDQTTRRLRGWGAYDPAIVSMQEGSSRQCSGFYFAGKDGTITGSVNPADRMDNLGLAKIFSEGEGRPLINGDWLDYVMQFRPDGTVVQARPFRQRYLSFKLKGAQGGVAPYGDLGDMSGWPASDYDERDRNVGPMITYAPITGWWSITLGPDVSRDGDVYPNVNAAMDSLFPAYRVMINRFGVVKVVRVLRIQPTGTTFDTTTITNWQDNGQTRSYYKNGLATTNTGVYRSVPATSYLTVDMLQRNLWWTTETP